LQPLTVRLKQEDAGLLADSGQAPGDHGAGGDMHIVAEFQVADDDARSAGDAAAVHPGTAGNANTPSHCSLLANAHVVADLNLIVALGAVTLKYSPETGDDLV
jgi:hypothetical protein